MLSYDCINGGNESLSILKKIESSEFIFCLYLVSSSYLKEMSNAFISTRIMVQFKIGKYLKDTS